MSIREEYIETANNLMKRLLGEQTEDEEETNIEPDEEEGDESEADDASEEKAQADQVEIFFDDLDEETQKVLIDKFKESLNVAEDDSYAQQKLVEALSKKPLVTFRAEELVRKLNLDI